MDNSYNIDELVNQLDFSSFQFSSNQEGLMLTNYEIAILKRYCINYEYCSSLGEVLSLIEQFFYENCDLDLDDLDSVSLSISERNYYQNVN